MSLLYPKPLRHELDQEQLEALLLWGAAKNVSDIVFCPGDPVWMQLEGRWHAVTDSSVTDAEVQAVVNNTSGQSNRAGYVRAGHSLDYAFGLRVPGERLHRQRFRANATASSKGLYVVLRVLPRHLPRVEDLDLDPALESQLYPSSGLVLVSGVMGSGKSTLLAALLHKAALAKGQGRQILTLEDPVEFDFSCLSAMERSAPLAQSAVGLDVEDWPGGVRTLTRRKGEIVMVGECRDLETIQALLSTVEQGVSAYTTVHAQDVPQTMTRLLNFFPEEERASAAAVLFANVRILLHQRLVPGLPPGRGRVALREWLVMDEAARSGLYSLPRKDLVPALRALVRTKGHSLAEDARRQRLEGRISEASLAAILAEQGEEQASMRNSPWR